MEKEECVWERYVQLTFKHGRLKSSFKEMAESGGFERCKRLTILWGISQIYLNTAEVYSCHIVRITPVMLHQVHNPLVLSQASIEPKPLSAMSVY